MKLVINGKTEEVALEKKTVEELLQYKNVKMPEMVSVELNGIILNRKEYAAEILKDGDVIEFLYFMGGGSRLITYDLRKDGHV